MLGKLEEIEKRYEQIQKDLQTPEIVSDLTKLKELGRANAELEPIVAAYRELKKKKNELEQAKALLEDQEEEIRELARRETEEISGSIEQLENKLKRMLLPKDINDEKGVIIEIKQGTGGDEAALFAADLYRMYCRFAERKGWKVEVIELVPTPIGGISNVAFAINAKGAYSLLKHESGVHRVQRVPKTEASGRIHTSAVSVVVMPEADEVDVTIRPEDLEIETFRSSGAGGQHVNKTESAVRVRHKPTGIVVSCQDERSQIQNRERAMRMLRTKLYDMQREQIEKEQATIRRSVGTGDRSEKIRTYNFPQGRVTDHRIGLTIYNLQNFLDGDMDEMLEALVQDEQTQKLAAATA